MKKRFVVSVNNRTTAEEDQAFLDWVKNKYSWWHWLDQTWLIVDRTDTLTAKSIRDKLNEIFPGRYNLVIEVGPGGTWAGFGAKSDEKDMFKWIRDNWE